MCVFSDDMPSTFSQQRGGFAVDEETVQDQNLCSQRVVRNYDKGVELNKAEKENTKNNFKRTEIW